MNVKDNIKSASNYVKHEGVANSFELMNNMHPKGIRIDVRAAQDIYRQTHPSTYDFDDSVELRYTDNALKLENLRKYTDFIGNGKDMSLVDMLQAGEYLENFQVQGHGDAWQYRLTGRAQKKNAVQEYRDATAFAFQKMTGNQNRPVAGRDPDYGGAPQADVTTIDIAINKAKITQRTMDEKEEYNKLNWNAHINKITELQIVELINVRECGHWNNIIVSAIERWTIDEANEADSGYTLVDTSGNNPDGSAEEGEKYTRQIIIASSTLQSVFNSYHSGIKEEWLYCVTSKPVHQTLAKAPLYNELAAQVFLDGTRRVATLAGIPLYSTARIDKNEFVDNIEDMTGIVDALVNPYLGLIDWIVGVKGSALSPLTFQGAFMGKSEQPVPVYSISMVAGFDNRTIDSGLHIVGLKFSGGLPPLPLRFSNDAGNGSIINEPTQRKLINNTPIYSIDKMRQFSAVKPILSVEDIKKQNVAKDQAHKSLLEQIEKLEDNSKVEDPSAFEKRVNDLVAKQVEQQLANMNAKQPKVEDSKDLKK